MDTKLPFFLAWAPHVDRCHCAARQGPGDPGACDKAEPKIQHFDQSLVGLPRQIRAGPVAFFFFFFLNLVGV